MNPRVLTHILTVTFLIFTSSCGKEEGSSLMRLSGLLEIQNEDAYGPAFVAISRSDDLEEIKNDPGNSMVVIVRADPNDHNFVIDLSESNLIPGEKIFIFAFVDNNYANGIPNPDKGDYIGFYFDSDNWKASYTLNSGYNPEININVNRRIYDFDSEIKGMINGNDTGELTLIAYAGDLNSFSFNDFDINDIIGYKKLAKGESQLPYTLEIMPYGYNMPIQNVFIIAMLDRNGNGKPDAGDIIGFHTGNAGNIPALVTIDKGLITNKHVDMNMEIAEPSGYDTPIKGAIEMPGGMIYNENSKPLYIIAAKTDDLIRIIDEPMSAIKYFKKIEPPEHGARKVKFEVDLSDTDLKAGDRIFIMALWDRNFVAGFPSPDESDYVGFYTDLDAMTPAYSLKDGYNKSILLNVTRKIYSFESEIKGSVIGEETGELTIVAYAGEINSLDFKKGIDFDAIIGYQNISKNETSTSYSVKILPCGYNTPIGNVYIIAMLDRNKNDKIDAGDMVGFYTENANNFPTLITVNNGLSINKNIEMTIEVSESSGYDAPITGVLEMPFGKIYDRNSDPLYIIIAKSDDPGKIIDDPVNVIKYFEKIEPPNPGKHEISYKIDLSNTDLRAGDEIVITALWDKDFTSGFPQLTAGDYVGFYVNLNALNSTYKLQDGYNSSVDFEVSRRVYDFESSISGSIRGDDNGEVTLIAYAISVNLLDLEIIDPDAIIGYKKIPKTAYEADYTMDIFPYGQNAPISYVFLIAFLDRNENGIIDDNDYVGYHTTGELAMPPAWFTAVEGENQDIDVEIVTQITTPDEILTIVLNLISQLMGVIF